MQKKLAVTCVLALGVAWHPVEAGKPGLLLPSMRHCDLTLKGQGREVVLSGVPLAVTAADQQHGLSHLKPGQQPLRMLFVWPQAAPRAVWMHDTPAPLDAAFLDGQGRIFQVVALAPNSDAYHYPQEWPTAMLEADAGDLARQGVAVGWVLVRHRCYGGGEPDRTTGAAD